MKTGKHLQTFSHHDHRQTAMMWITPTARRAHLPMQRRWWLTYLGYHKVNLSLMHQQTGTCDKDETR